MQYHKIHYADHNLLWMTIGSLLFVALMPFSTDLVGDFPTNTLCAFIFELNLLITSSLLYLQWSYATSNRHLIDPSMSDETIRAGKQQAAVIPVFSLVGIIMAIAGIPWSTLVYLFAPLGIPRAASLWPEIPWRQMGLLKYTDSVYDKPFDRHAVFRKKSGFLSPDKSQGSRIHAIAFVRWWRTVVKYMSEMGPTTCT